LGIPLDVVRYIERVCTVDAQQQNVLNGRRGLQPLRRTTGCETHGYPQQTDPGRDVSSHDSPLYEFTNAATIHRGSAANNKININVH
jgi:hypothetical protein